LNFYFYFFILSKVVEDFFFQMRVLGGFVDVIEGIVILVFRAAAGVRLDVGCLKDFRIPIIYHELFPDAGSIAGATRENSNSYPSGGCILSFMQLISRVFQMRRGRDSQSSGRTLSISHNYLHFQAFQSSSKHQDLCLLRLLTHVTPSNAPNHPAIF